MARALTCDTWGTGSREARIEMSTLSAIEWTDATWNPVTGCSKVSQGCKNCYAETMHGRLRSMGSKKYQRPFDTITLHDRELGRRFGVKPKRVFTCSMSDLFHEEVPDRFLSRVFLNMSAPANSHHTFQILTKRPSRMRGLLDYRDRPAEWPWPWCWPLPNVWLGTSVEDKDNLYRILELKETPAKVRFLSIEPLLEPVATELEPLLYNIDWIIVGGESGRNARPMETAWVRDIRDICLSKDIPFFFKQWGGRNKKAAGRELDGRIWDQMPQ